MAELINGGKIAHSIDAAVKKGIQEIYSAKGVRPKLVSIMVGQRGDAAIYVNMQKKAAEASGIEFDLRKFESEVDPREIYEEIDRLNMDRSVTAIIVQKPLPENLSHDSVVARIRPEKDAEGIHPYNLGRILRKDADIVPCTPGAVMKILSEKNVDLYGKEVVIVGHSAIVGKPLSLMMLNEMATTTVCHLGTSQKGDLPGHTRRADILIVAVGRPEMVNGDWVAVGAVVIDIGINRVGNRIVGDVKFSEVAKKASLITPVPGGVGPVTVSILMRNVFRAYRGQNVKL
ncbi:MAG: bifunctional 5,10-methylenetetrahydrofolate dehydrogenase/5,10-methenyltetrahydrofolate cyclohydrolase [Candidatus Omnitrophota bacterium]